MSGRKDRRTKDYRTSVERQRDLLIKVCWTLFIGFVFIAIMLAALTRNTVLAMERLEVLSPFAEYLGDKNLHCEGEYEKLFCNAKYDWDSMTMIAIAKCESGLNPNAFHVNTNMSVDSGLLQVNSIHGYAMGDLFNPVKNVEIGYEVWQSQGYYAWTVYGGSCFYAKYAELAGRTLADAQ